MRIVKVESLGEQIFKLLKSRIFDNEYGDETILNERAISQELGVSRTPVREALKALEAEGWVACIPYKGVVVKRMSPGELSDTFQIRRALEVLMIELAMPHVTAATIAEMEANMARQAVKANANHFREFLELDTDFHNILLRVNPNDMLRKSVTGIRDKISRLGMSSLFNSEARFGESLEEHQAILEAVRSGNQDKAKAAMDRHMRRIFETAVQYVSKESRPGHENGERSANG